MGSTSGTTGERRRTFGVVLNPVQERIPSLRSRSLLATGVPNQGRAGWLERNPAAPPHAAEDNRSDDGAAEYQGTYSDTRDYTWVNLLRTTRRLCRLCCLGSDSGKRGGGGSGGREHGRIRQIIGCHVFSESDVKPIRAHDIEECPRGDGSPSWNLCRPSSRRRISALLNHKQEMRLHSPADHRSSAVRCPRRPRCRILEALLILACHARRERGEIHRVARAWCFVVLPRRPVVKARVEREEICLRRVFQARSLEVRADDTWVLPARVGHL